MADSIVRFDSGIGPWFRMGLVVEFLEAGLALVSTCATLAKGTRVKAEDKRGRARGFPSPSYLWPVEIDPLAEAVGKGEHSDNTRVAQTGLAILSCQHGFNHGTAITPLLFPSIQGDRWHPLPWRFLYITRATAPKILFLFFYKTITSISHS